MSSIGFEHIKRNPASDEKSEKEGKQNELSLDEDSFLSFLFIDFSRNANNRKIK